MGKPKLTYPRPAHTHLQFLSLLHFHPMIHADDQTYLDKALLKLPSASPNDLDLLCFLPRLSSSLGDSRSSFGVSSEKKIQVGRERKKKNVGKGEKIQSNIY